MAKHLSAVVCVGLALSIWCASAHAQRSRNQQELPPANVSGKIVDLRRGLIQIIDDQERQYLVQVRPDATQVFVSGTAKPSFLQPRMFVRFTGKLDGNAAEEPVAELQIFVPTEQQGVGLFRNDPTDPDAGSVVAGQLRSLRNGKYTMAIGREAVQFELAEDVAITVDVFDYSIAKPGDAIEVRGRFVAEDKIVSDRVTIELAEPLAGPEPRKRGRSRTADRGQDEPPPEE